MVDIVNKAVRSRMMSSIRSKDTTPEMIVRRFLHGKGFRYRLHVSSLPGRPDIVLPKYRVVIFVNGCFWHRHKGCRYATTPQQNQEKWQTKFNQNIARDNRNIEQLHQTGWKVIVIWECWLFPSEAATCLNSLLEMITNPIPVD